MFPSKKPKSDAERFLEAFSKQVGASPEAYLRRKLASGADEAELKKLYNLLAEEIAKKSHSTAIRYDEVFRRPQPRRHAPAAQDSAPVCARCGVKMVRRTGQSGARKGQTYWGCPNYPACRYTKKDENNEKL